MTELNHDEHWRQLANPGHHHTRDAILPLLAKANRRACSIAPLLLGRPKT